MRECNANYRQFLKSAEKLKKKDVNTEKGSTHL